MTRGSKPTRSGRDGRRRMRGAAVLAVATALALALGSCAGIPLSGSVHVGQPDTSDEDLEFDFLPSGPQKGASQQEILSGFIDAASSPQNNYKIAREFLTTGAEWTPSAGVIVDQGQRTTQQLGDSAISLAVSPIAQLDQAGVYSEVDVAAPLPLTYKFVEQGGEWRISQPPSGVVIDRATFDQVFSAHSLYFFDPELTYLVPDVRWFPTRADTGTSTTIVTQLLAGPSPWLRDSGAVVSAFPTGTALDSEAVPIVDQVASVDLNSAALDADTRDWELMQLQLTRSLSNVSSVTGVDITVEQNPVEVADAASLPIIPRVDARPLIESDAGVGFLTGDAVSPVVGLSPKIEAVSAASVALDPTQAAAAVRADDGVHLVRVGHDTVRLDQRTGLIDPSIDPLGYVWSIPRGAPNQLIAFSPDGTSSFQIATTWPEADSIASLSISRDGTRVLALVSDGSNTSLLVAGITRSDNGTPLSVGERVEEFTSVGAPVAAAWIDDSTAALVVRDSTGEDRVWSQQLGGKRTSLGTTSGAVAIAGGNTLGQVRILTSAGELQQQRGAAWQSVASGVVLLGTQSGTPQ